MKVTVIFGETRVVVPCGQGDFLVSELIEKAVVRYRKAAGKTTDHYVHIHTLKSYNDGGILDLDDVLLDVVDDREQIVAEYEEQSGPSVPQGGDGTSGSSVGSASPDAFQSNRKLIPPSIPMKSAALSQPAVQPHRSSPSVTNSVRSSPALYIDSAIDAKLEHQPHKLLPSFLTNSSRDRTVTQSDRQLSSFSSSVAALRPQPEKAPMLNNNVDTRHSVEVTEHDLASGTGLQVLSVRRDSEPNIVSALEAEEKLSPMQSWAHSHQEGDLSKSGRPVRSPSESSEGSSSPGFNRFARDSSRQSLTGQNVLKWASAQERQQDFYDQVPADDQQVLGVQTDLQHGRREPLGQSWSPGEDRTVDTRLVVLKNEDGPLGIHVVPHKDQLGRESGIAIQGIEPGGRVHRSGQIQINDVIVEINGNSLRQTNFSEAQEIFRDALQTDEIRLRVRRPAATRTSSTSSANDSSAPISPKPHSLFKSVPPPPPQRSPNTTLSNQSSLSSLPRHNQLSPTQSAGPVLETSSGSSAQSMMPSNSRKLGKKIHIELTKGPEGLGFSITTRDNPAGGLAPPIYVKNILPKGAAIADGRLKSGDRLLEVNNMDMTGKSQNEVVAILRNTKRGSTVTLCVSRLDTGDSSSSLPRQMAISGISVPCTPTTKRLLANALRYNSLLGMSWDGRDDTLSHRESPSGPKTTNNDAISSDKRVLALNIPLNETGSAGLGISVKGKTSTASDGHHKDLGIFIKAVIHGGAASKDGRLQINDQLLCVNDDDLKKKTNAEAMETLRKAMHTEGPMPGHIKLTVERKVSASVSSGSTPEPWESSTTDSTVTGRNSTDGGMEPLGNRVVEVTLAQHNERKLSTTVTAEATLSPVEPVDAQNVIEQMRNPVLDRITGGGNSKLSDTTMDENESYHIATHEDSDGEESYDPPSFTNQSTIPTPTQPHNTSNVMMIEEDNNKQTVLQQPRRIEESQLRARPLSTIGGIGIAAAAEAKQKRTSELESEKRSASPPPSSTASGEESNMNTFDREAFGRRSFSEKRKASNGKNKEVVAKVKALREEMKLETASAQASEGEATGPSLGLKKNSSFESLQAMVEDTIKGSGEPSLYKPPNRVSRGRGCNESFRAAVDRSYVPTPPSDHMDSDDKQGHRQRPRGHSASVNVDSELHRKDEKVSEENEPDQMVRGPMSSSFSGGEIDSEKKKSKKSKNGGGILGLFRLTKARKSLEERGSKSSVKASKAEEKERSSSLSQAAKSGQPDSDSHYNVQEKIQDYYKRLHEKQKAQVAESYSQQPEFGTYPRNERSRGNSSSNPPPVPPHANNYAKAEQLASIRAQHQRRHQDRQGQYPTDTTDDFYERKIKERELKRSHHGKSKSIDDTANLEFFAAVNNRAYGTGAEFNPRHKSSQPSGMSNSVPNRASFYADPRYHDYHRSTQSNYYPNDHNSNVSAQQPPLVPAHRSSVTSKIDAYNNSVAKPTPANNNSDYAKINKADRPGAHRRFPSYDSSAAPFHLTSNRHEHDVILDYDDPQGSENSLYARVRKQPSMGHAVSNPSRV
ncbi:partitioning defective 3 homolog isoform X16 [Watersipora subatra]|uniref:partitioning defective 3 homolog isoform X16 n=1 Tax=Watersipora subatra TaxID=2589382 RepID=UPI00355B9680